MRVLDCASVADVTRGAGFPCCHFASYITNLERTLRGKLDSRAADSRLRLRICIGRHDGDWAPVLPLLRFSPPGSTSSAGIKSTRSRTSSAFPPRARRCGASSRSASLVSSPRTLQIHVFFCPGRDKTNTKNSVLVTLTRSKT